jgi:hypothetical protein
MNQPLVVDEPVEFEKRPVRKITDHFRGTYKIYLEITKKTLQDVNM